jgi:hypothetical protein
MNEKKAICAACEARVNNYSPHVSTSTKRSIQMVYCEPTIRKEGRGAVEDWRLDLMHFSTRGACTCPQAKGVSTHGGEPFKLRIVGGYARLQTEGEHGCRRLKVKYAHDTRPFRKPFDSTK